MRGCSELAVMLLNGEGGARDPAQGLQLMWRACQGAHARACSQIGVLVSRGAPSPIPGRSPGYWLSEGCQRGDALGCSMIAEMGSQGMGSQGPTMQMEPSGGAGSGAVRIP